MDLRFDIRLAVVFFVLAFVPVSNPQAGTASVDARLPRRVKVFRHHSTVVWSCGASGVNALVYKAGLAIDADGAFKAYHPDARLGLDDIRHAGYPGNWWALATDTGKTTGRPVVQGKNDPAPGYYVSMTSLFDPTIPNEHDPRRFVDAATVPYVVLPPAGLKHAKLGDFSTVVNLQNGKVQAAIVADESAPELKMGEGSIALAVALGINPNPRTGGTEHGVAYVIYPGSGNGRPRTVHDIVSISQSMFEQWGGLRQLGSCLQ